MATVLSKTGSVFGVKRPYRPTGKLLSIFGESLETPFGPAAGPNTQLTQNILAAYYAGSRFFELKTVQIMDGDELAGLLTGQIDYFESPDEQNEHIYTNNL